MNQISAASRPLKPRPFDPLLGTASNATPEQKTAILREYYDRKITYSLPKKSLTLTFGNEINVINLAKLNEPQDFVALAVQLTYRPFLNRRDIREILKRVAEVKNFKLFFFFCDENLKLKKGKPQALKPAV